MIKDIKILKHCLIYISFGVILFGCVEEIDFESIADFESALVVEASITDQLEFQEIKLSRSYEIDAEGPIKETQANVNIKTSAGLLFEFVEESPGNYKSVAQFKAEPNVDYELMISTNDGRSYGSTKEQFSGSTQIDDLYYERGFNENGEEGVSFFVDSFNPQGNSQFYRYTYEETYKIIAPSYSGLDLITTLRVPPFDFELQIKPEQQQVCYNTKKSNEIIIENTNLYNEDRVDGFRVRFVNRSDYIMSHRYSILVTQYVQSNEAFTYYTKLKEQSGEESLFSQIQPGFLNGNVFSQTNENENVLGFFEVVKANIKRIYFNYEDVFPNEPLPPYYVNCNDFAPFVTSVSGASSPLMDALDAGNKYYGMNDGLIDGGPYLLVAPSCGNCTVLGEGSPPDWWED